MNSEDLIREWVRICDQVRSYDHVTEGEFNAFVPRLVPQAMSESFLMLTAENEFIRQWVEANYLNDIVRALADLHQTHYTVALAVDTTATPATPQPAGAPTPSSVTPPARAVTPAGGAGASGAVAAATHASPVEGAPAGLMPPAQGSIPIAHSDLNDGRPEAGVAAPAHHAAESVISEAPAANWAESAGLPTTPASVGANTANLDTITPFTQMTPAEESFDEGLSPLERKIEEARRAATARNRRQETPTETAPSEASSGVTHGAAAGGFPANAPSSIPGYGHQPAREERPARSAAYTFENFVIGDSNRMAYSMAIRVAEAPGSRTMNPFFIYGKSGLGKTHLVRAIQNYIERHIPHLSVVYEDASAFLNKYVEATASYERDKQSYKNFQRRYEQADVLIIDDVQSLQGKKQTLEIVFQIINMRIERGQQVILSADRAPKNIDIDQRYYSRFNSGGTCDIQPPEVETKLSIIRSFIRDYMAMSPDVDISISDETQMYIAENSSSNIRELKSAVVKVISHTSAFGETDISLPEVRKLLEDHFSGGAMKKLTVEDIQAACEEYYKVSHEAVLSDNRTRGISHARQMAMYLCREMLDIPYAQVGKAFGDRDHATIMYSVKKVEERFKSEPEVREESETIRKMIRDR
ncbi:chromosomal replication initiator protein DnaA [Eggerthellaceae bacterium zg-1084]|uniref:chromosomal replication initiator protein DnaA n=1 Tax=Berryella wangjianweii TaxID=2734634 RepID=UPI001557B652|nr:chromosomal replication initiator protein DnaA [Berryella wangjianweii]NPD30940.1 chromosomal replication initiator protein DnaA [Berryella wangjianweii]NPD31805.1 chromosomal replication initiator protein DnaA [Eggerthellaceae bacterium zg-997]